MDGAVAAIGIDGARLIVTWSERRRRPQSWLTPDMADRQPLRAVSRGNRGAKQARLSVENDPHGHTRQ